MMQAVEMYMIIAVMLVTTSLGSLHNCLHYCNVSSEYSSIPTECNCSLQDLQRNWFPTSNHHVTPAEDSGIYYEPVKLNTSQATSFEERNLHIHKQLIVNTSKSFSVEDRYDENHIRTTNKYKKRDSNFPKSKQDTKGVLLNLYLDLDLNTTRNNNRSQIEELKKMIENFQAVEKDLSECINLHIYVFSKYIDTNIKTHTNWGHSAENDNLSNSQELTEIQSKCEHPVSIIKQSIFEIKQSFSHEEAAPDMDEDQIIHRVESNKDNLAPTTTYRSGNNLNLNTKSETYTTLATHPTDDLPSETTEGNTEKTDKPSLKKLELNFPNKDFSGTSNDFSPTVPFYDQSTVINNDDDHFRTTTMTDRALLREEDVLIPRIITKEFSNGSLTSAVDGFEEIPNSDFITNTVTSTESNDAVTSNSNEIVESNLVEIHGNLYFSFGKEQIPARFIQQSNGELNVAIDGFSMCNHMLQVNTSRFMNLLCKCINLQKCI